MPALNKRSNEYADVVRSIYDRTPKAVFAALAVSLMACRDNGEGETGDSGGDAILEALLEEWSILHENGIVPQRPPKV
jgi:hypothetical protein